MTSVERCDKVAGLTGEVHVVAVEAEAMIDFHDAMGNILTKGDRFFLLTPRGEGYRLAWADGILFEMDASGVRSRGQCEPESERCWALVDSQP